MAPDLMGPSLMGPDTSKDAAVESLNSDPKDPALSPNETQTNDMQGDVLNKEADKSVNASGSESDSGFESDTSSNKTAPGTTPTAQRKNEKTPGTRTASSQTDSAKKNRSQSKKRGLKRSRDAENLENKEKRTPGQKVKNPHFKKPAVDADAPDRKKLKHSSENNSKKSSLFRRKTKPTRPAPPPPSTPGSSHSPPKSSSSKRPGYFSKERRQERQEKKWQHQQKKDQHQRAKQERRRTSAAYQQEKKALSTKNLTRDNRVAKESKKTELQKLKKQKRDLTLERKVNNPTLKDKMTAPFTRSGRQAKKERQSQKNLARIEKLEQEKRLDQLKQEKLERQVNQEPSFKERFSSKGRRVRRERKRRQNAIKEQNQQQVFQKEILQKNQATQTDVSPDNSDSDFYKPTAAAQKMPAQTKNTAKHQQHPSDTFYSTGRKNHASAERQRTHDAQTSPGQPDTFQEPPRQRSELNQSVQPQRAGNARRDSLRNDSADLEQANRSETPPPTYSSWNNQHSSSMNPPKKQNSTDNFEHAEGDVRPEHRRSSFAKERRHSEPTPTPEAGVSSENKESSLTTGLLSANSAAGLATALGTWRAGKKQDQKSKAEDNAPPENHTKATEKTPDRSEKTTERQKPTPEKSENRFDQKATRLPQSFSERKTAWPENTPETDRKNDADRSHQLPKDHQQDPEDNHFYGEDRSDLSKGDWHDD